MFCSWLISIKKNCLRRYIFKFFSKSVGKKWLFLKLFFKTFLYFHYSFERWNFIVAPPLSNVNYYFQELSGKNYRQIKYHKRTDNPQFLIKWTSRPTIRTASPAPSTAPNNLLSQLMTGNSDINFKDVNRTFTRR